VHRPGRGIAPLRRLRLRLRRSRLVSTTKLRQAGFGDCVDTEVMFKTWLKRLADRGVIPQP
jgi:hypothetical protein